MPRLPTAERLRAEIALLRLLSDIQPALTPDGAYFDIDAGRWRIVVAISASGNGVATAPSDRLTPCEQACMDTVRELGNSRHQGDAIYQRVQQSARQAGQREWGRSAVAAALANLVAKQLLVNNRDKRGYGMPETSNTESQS